MIFLRLFSVALWVVVSVSAETDKASAQSSGLGFNLLSSFLFPTQGSAAGNAEEKPNYVRKLGETNKEDIDDTESNNGARKLTYYYHTPKPTPGRHTPKPTNKPRTPRPTNKPRTPRPTNMKTPRPTNKPRTPRPTNAPRTPRPTNMKTARPTNAPRTPRPTNVKTPRPTNKPRTPRPTNAPRTPRPTNMKTARPTNAPRTPRPTNVKTPRPTNAPRTPRPTNVKTPRPTNKPRTPRPTNAPRTPRPTNVKTPRPTNKPRTPRPTNAPRTPRPTNAKTARPTNAPRTPRPTPGGCVPVVKVSFEDFENGKAKGWKNAKINKGSPFTKFLGRYNGRNLGSKAPQKTFMVSKTAENVWLEFDFYEIDGWGLKGKDYLCVIINGVMIDLGRFNTNKNENGRTADRKGVWFGIESKNPPANIGFNKHKKDQIHHVSMKIPPSYYKKTGKLTIRFEAQLNTDKQLKNESAGYDNISVVAKFDCSRHLMDETVASIDDEEMEDDLGDGSVEIEEYAETDEDDLFLMSRSNLRG